MHGDAPDRARPRCRASWRVLGGTSDKARNGVRAFSLPENQGRKRKMKRAAYAMIASAATLTASAATLDAPRLPVPPFADREVSAAHALPAGRADGPRRVPDRRARQHLIYSGQNS